MSMFRIGKVAERMGVSASALRYYERRGILRPSRLPNGYRVYGEDAIKVVRFLHQAKAVGFTLKEINQLIPLTHHGRRPCEAVRNLASRHLTDIDAKIRRLRSIRNTLRDLLAIPSPAHSDELCPLLSSATSRPPNRG
jgi:MerR family transcriptional regulator, copper efflux regulator